MTNRYSQRGIYSSSTRFDPFEPLLESCRFEACEQPSSKLVPAHARDTISIARRWEQSLDLYYRALAVVAGVLAGFRGGRLNFIPFDYLVVLVVGIFFAAGADAAVRLARSETDGIGLSLEGAILQTVVSGLLLILVVDAMRRNYVVFRSSEPSSKLPPDQPAIVSATGKFESFGREANRYFEPASIHEEPGRLLLISPPRLGSEPPVAVDPMTGEPTKPMPEDPGEDFFWFEIPAWRVIEVEHGEMYFGFSHAPTVRYRIARSRGSKQVFVAVHTESQARWLYEWVDLARGRSMP